MGDNKIEPADIEIAVLKTQIAHLTAQMEKMTEQMAVLTKALNRTQGAFWAGSLFTVGIVGMWQVFTWAYSILGRQP